MENIIFQKYIDTPIGWIKIQSDSDSILSVSFVENEGNKSTQIPVILLDAENQLKEYFAGKRKTFKLKLNPLGTVFQKNIWQLVENVDFGKTASYLKIAKLSGSEKNTRAVGLANGKNPIPIIIPCHRIIGSNGKLTGYAGGLDKKRWLLQHEIEHSQNTNLLF